MLDVADDEVSLEVEEGISLVDDGCSLVEEAELDDALGDGTTVTVHVPVVQSEAGGNVPGVQLSTSGQGTVVVTVLGGSVVIAEELAGGVMIVAVQTPVQPDVGG